MNDNSVAFIITVNNEQYYEECCYYINRLIIPAEFDIDIIAVHEANSMCAAYNLGMQSTNAKYKIYLHQDVFIRNKNFINDLLAIFRRDKSIGMVGMVGGNGMPKTGVTYRAWNVGCVDCREPDMAYNLVCDPKETQDMYVEAVDGLLIATQRDIPWREDIFSQFDFYDISQSFEMRKRGYQIVVPHQKIPWVIHDSGFAKMAHYDQERKKCLREYPEFLYAEGGFEFEYNEEWDLLSTELAKRIEGLMGQGEWENVETIIEQYRSGKRKDSTLEELGIMSDINRDERKAGIQIPFFSNANCFEQMYEKYKHIRFLFFRMELNIPETEYQELIKAITDGSISCEAVIHFVLHAVSDKKSVLEKIWEVYQKAGEKCKEERIKMLYEVVKDKPIPIAYIKKARITES